MAITGIGRPPRPGTRRRRLSNRMWGGSRYWTNRAIDAVPRMRITSRKRAVVLGGNRASDHNVFNLTADAVDLATTTGGDNARRIARALGITNYTTGNFNHYFVKRTRFSRTYRVQILWAVRGHFDHVHVGVRRV